MPRRRSSNEADAWPRRRPTPRTRWRIGKAGDLGWYAGPIGIGVYADLSTRRRWIFFPSWEAARDAVFGKASQ